MLLPFFAGQAAERLINEKALVAEAHRFGLRVSDDELRDELQHGQLAATLFPAGKFIGDDEYQSFVQRNNLTIPNLRTGEGFHPRSQNARPGLDQRLRRRAGSPRRV